MPPLMPMSSTASIHDLAAPNVSPCGSALDEAFALLSDMDLRIDAAQGPANAHNWGEQAEPIISKINEQMLALDEQRQRLQQLLTALTDS